MQHISYHNFNLDYCKSGAIQYGVFATLILATLCFILTKVTRQYSWVDRIWSIIPILYGFHFLAHQKYCLNLNIHPRQYIMICLATLWGIRLTFNFVRKGGYRPGGEDYRWQFLRTKLHWTLMEFLNFSFTAYYQLILIYWFATPINFANGAPLNNYDYVLIVLFLLFLAIETIADNQQWAYQTQKYRLRKQKKTNIAKIYQIGFITTGLFQYSRHPNFFAEQSLWIVYYLFSHNAIGLNISWLGCFQLVLLFQSSTWLTEYISAGKYPLYNLYKQQTSRFLPLPSSRFDPELKQK